MTRLIKKYKNRRLYDTQTSQYITIEDLQHYVMQGVEFRVEDSTTNEDLTGNTLLQIFVEMENSTTRFLSTSLLRQLIIAANHPLNTSFKTILEQVFNTVEKTTNANPYLKNYQEVTENWNKNLETILEKWKKFI